MLFVIMKCLTCHWFKFFWHLVFIFKDIMHFIVYLIWQVLRLLNFFFDEALLEPVSTRIGSEPVLIHPSRPSGLCCIGCLSNSVGLDHPPKKSENSCTGLSLPRNPPAQPIYNPRLDYLACQSCRDTLSIIKQWIIYLSAIALDYQDNSVADNVIQPVRERRSPHKKIGSSVFLGS